ncbi:MAG: hypothetical protein J6Y28_09620 [Acholeplasmatales bacterium]|nr:hypothetical protein [Methanobrevibacter sp.]MBP5446416.1 hypothetical protein [Acholeplasmatales bacterium]
MKDFYIGFKQAITFSLILVAIFGLCLLWDFVFKRTRRTPVKEINIDSIITASDSIKIKINNLDSIKNAKVIEVITLDNDSSIKLFYELVSE